VQCTTRYLPFITVQCTTNTMRGHTMIRTTTGDAHKAIATLTPFATSGALSGRRPHGETFTAWESGRLAQQHVDSFRASTFAVYSYSTPIAWVTDGRWVIPSDRYSLTTSRHQSAARHGAHLSGLDVAAGVAA
jgi:hypothetical protein